MKKWKFNQTFLLAPIFVVFLMGCNSKNVPTPESRPMPTEPTPYRVNATVIKGDGSSFEFSEAYIAKRMDNGWRISGYNYENAKLNKMFFYTDLANIQIPLDKIKSVQLISDTILKRNHLGIPLNTFKVTLTNGEEVVGQQLNMIENDFVDMKFGGNTIANGIPDEYEIIFSFIKSIIFSLDDQGIIVADVEDFDGKITHVSDPWCRSALREEGNLSLVPVISMINFEVDGINKEINLEDIQQIDFDQSSITLTNGQQYIGSIDDYAIIGNIVTVKGLRGFLYTNFNDFNDLQKIVFHK